MDIPAVTFKKYILNFYKNPRSPFGCLCIKKKLSGFFSESWLVSKKYFTFAQQIKTITMRHIQIHINPAKRFSLLGCSGAGVLMYQVFY
jgi:hypothetical protein